MAGDLIDRQAGDPYVVNLMERWFDQLIKWSRRDQVAFNYSRSYFPDDTVNDLPYYENILTNSITERFQHIGQLSVMTSCSYSGKCYSGVLNRFRQFL